MSDIDCKNPAVVVVGMGYIGLPTAAMMAAAGTQVLGVDVNASVVDTINQGQIHIVEPGLEEKVREGVASGKLWAASTPSPGDVFIVAVPTPFDAEQNPDLTYIEQASRAIAPHLRSGNLVILESTSPVGATETMARWMADERADLSFPTSHGELSDIRVAHCPERVLPGKVMEELVGNDRVLGGLTPKCGDAAAAFYRRYVRGECFVTDARTAEMAKLAENSYRDVNIAFANELSIICDKLGIDVWELIRIANRHPRVSILQPGPGVGGHCIAVDPWFIVASAPDEARLIRTSRQVNDAKPEWVLDKIDAACAHYRANAGQDAGEPTIACYGLTFKPNIDDLRESPAVEIVRALANRHRGRVLAIEPHIASLPEKLGRAELVEEAVARQQADIHVLLVDHDRFERGAPDVPAELIVDSRGMWKPA